MTLPELHPDELLAREASSSLTAREWADLSAHLARCPACALDRAARREAARVRAPSDLDHAIAARVVGRLMSGQHPELLPAKHTGASGGGGRRLAYVALALLLISGTATAGVALVAQIRHRDEPRVEAEARPTPRARVAAPKRQRTATDPRGSEEAAALSPPPTPEAAPVAVEPPPPSPAAATRPMRLHERDSDRTIAGSASRPSPGRALAGRDLGERSHPDAATLLSQAEAAESAGRPNSASALYGELGRQFPGTREEIVARALHGQLALDRLESPGRALALFERYLAVEPHGTLAEEARLGRARALERLGRASDERAAWRELLRAHPRSVHAAAARARLATLDGP